MYKSKTFFNLGIAETKHNILAIAHCQTYSPVKKHQNIPYQLEPLLVYEACEVRIPILPVRENA